MDMFREVVNNIVAATPVESTDLRNYFQNEMSLLQNNLSNVSTDYLTGVNNTINMYNDDIRIYNNQIIVSDAEQYITGDVIYVVNEDNILNTNFTMKRYIMCKPSIRVAYDNDKISGFDGMFIDVSENENELEYNEDYLRVMNGVSVEGEDGEGYTIIHEDENELNTIDQFNIIDSWNNIENMIHEGIDPTCIDEE